MLDQWLPLDMDGDLGQRLRALRESIGLSQDALGNRAGVSGQSIHLIETGRRKPRIDTAVQLSAALGISLHALLFGREEVGGEEEGGAAVLSLDIVDVYRNLRGPERRALLQNARTLHELQSSYPTDESGQSEESEGEPTPLHQPGTMPEIEPVAADDNSDLKRAQRQREARREQAQRGD